MTSEIISQRIELLLEREGIQQKQLAEFLVMPPSTLNGYMKGRRDFPITVIVNIANYFSVSTDYLLGLSDEEKRN